MAYDYHPYTGDYTQYGSQPEFNWFDFMYGPGGTNAAPSSPGGGPSGTPPVPAPPAKPSGLSVGALASVLGNHGDHDPTNTQGGGPVMPTGYTTSPYAGQDAGGNALTSKGALAGIAGMMDPTPGNLLAEAVKFGYDPSAYMDTKPMTIPGVGTMATQPGIVRGLLGNIPFGGALANYFGEATANKLADIANSSRAGTEGYGIGNFDDDYGRTRTVGIDPSGPFGTSTITGPGSFGWQRRHQIMSELQGQNKPGAGGHDGSGRADPGGPGGVSHDPRGHEGGGYRGMAEGGRVGALSNLGRGDDDTLAHVAHGELMLPPEFQRRQPGVMRRLHEAMRDEGMDPRRYRAGDVIDVNPDTGLPEYGFWKTIKKHVLPVAAGAATSYFTGSDILGGLAAGVGSKLLGNDWGTSIAQGALTGLGSWATGLSGDGPGALGGLFGAGAGASGLRGATGNIAGAPSGTNTDDGGMLSGVTDWLKNNPGQAALGGAAALGLLSGAGKPSKTKDDGSDYQDMNDPEYDAQVKKGWTLDRTPTMPGGDFNWYSYGQIPQWQFFDNVNADAVPNMADGGSVKAGNKAALSILNAVPRGNGGGQDDIVHAVLAPDEHVIDADVVAAIGDGSSDEGHRKLESMKKNIRKHKRGAALSKIPPRARSPLDYLAEAR